MNKIRKKNLYFFLLSFTNFYFLVFTSKYMEMVNLLKITCFTLNKVKKGKNFYLFLLYLLYFSKIYVKC